MSNDIAAPQRRRCLSCRAERLEAEVTQALTPSFAPIPGEYMCRDRDACYEAFRSLPLPREVED